MNKSKLLRPALWANAVFSGATGVAMLVAGGPIAALIGIETVAILTVIGVGLILFSADLIHQATRESISTQRALAASVADIGWVAGSVVLLAGWHSAFTATGIALVIGVAVVVEAFATMQLVGVRALRAAG